MKYNLRERKPKNTETLNKIQKNVKKMSIQTKLAYVQLMLSTAIERNCAMFLKSKEFFDDCVQFIDGMGDTNLVQTTVFLQKISKFGDETHDFGQYTIEKSRRLNEMVEL